MEKTEILLRLMMVKGLGLTRYRTMIDYFNRISFQFSNAELRWAGLSDDESYAFFHPDAERLLKNLRWSEKPGNSLVTCVDPLYPELLKQIDNFPPILFVHGKTDVLSSRQIATVGSRAASHYGEQWGYFFSRELATFGITITSGLALGIDGICHQGALDGNGNTIAVLGCGLNTIYPKSHTILAKRIVDSGGCVVSEFLPHEPPKAEHFPRRNRIISGLSKAVLVVEASMHSGSLITARYGLEQGKDVFAIPGTLGAQNSQGCHWLIQQGAYLVSSPTDIIEQMGSSLHWIPEKSVIVNQSSADSHEQAELPLAFGDVLANIGDDVTPVDIVAERTGESVADIAVKLLELELSGWVLSVPGGYVRVRRAGYV